MKYKFWWMALMGISAYFGLGLVLLMATGATYLYHPVVVEGDIQAEQKTHRLSLWAVLSRACFR